MQVGIEVLSKIPAENRREYIQSFKFLPQFAGCKKNCTFNQLFEDVGDLNRFMWVEYWRTENAMEEYLQSERFKTILGAIDTLGELMYFNKVRFQNTQQQRQSKE
jgi:quinol monooxygenase YgiN